MACDGEFHWRLAETDSDIRLLAPLVLIDMYREVGRGRLNPDKAFRAMYECFRMRRAVMIFCGDKIVGTLGLVEMDFWYSDDPQLVEQWAYIAPQFRSFGSIRCIFEAAREIARRDGFDQCNIVIFSRTRKKGRSEAAHVGEQFSFAPAGAVLELEAAE